MSVFLRAFCLIAGLAMAAYAFVQASILRFFAFSDVAPDPADAAILSRASVFGYVIVALLLAGAVLSFPRPRAASIAFLLAGGLSLVLGSVTESRYLLWFGAALVLAALVHLAYRIERDKEPAAPELPGDPPAPAAASPLGDSA